MIKVLKEEQNHMVPSSMQQPKMIQTAGSKQKTKKKMMAKGKMSKKTLAQLTKLDKMYDNKLGEKV